METMEIATQGARTIQLVGVSVRAAAQSARRSGWQPIAWDQFADADLQAIAPAHRVAAWQHPDFLSRWAETPATPWLYTGPLENDPALVGQLARHHELLGNTPSVLRKIRDPFRLHSVLRQHGFPSPAVHPPASPPATGAWVLKPLHSGGGFRIRVIRDPANRPAPEDRELGEWRESRDFFWQQFVPGTPCSAVFIASPRETRLIGATRQILGTPPESNSPFRYLGSMGPLRLNRIRGALTHLGEVLTREFSLRGVFGVDFVRQGDRVVTVEVNPRYPASCEILERALPVRILEEHVAACRDVVGSEYARPCDNNGPNRHSANPIYWGKLILYARHPLRWSPHGSRRLVEKSRQFPWPPWADIPPGNEVIPRGHPVMTIFRQATSLRQLRRQLSPYCPQSVAEPLFRLGRKKGI
jgi:uncharacterized protein